jgi:hypothetical protein
MSMGLLNASFTLAVFFAVATVRADVSGFEHLKDISIDCGKAPLELAKPHEIKGHRVCTYENRLCKVLSNSELQFEAFITVDCEMKSAKDACPDIGACAKPNQLTETVADEVRKLNDPNFSGSPDGASDPLEKPAPKGKARP